MKNVEIRVGFINQWRMFSISEQIFIFNFEDAVNIVKLSKMKNVHLRQYIDGILIEWDNL